MSENLQPKVNIMLIYVLKQEDSVFHTPYMTIVESYTTVDEARYQLSTIKDFEEATFITAAIYDVSVRPWKEYAQVDPTQLN